MLRMPTRRKSVPRLVKRALANTSTPLVHMETRAHAVRRERQAEARASVLHQGVSEIIHDMGSKGAWKP